MPPDRSAADQLFEVERRIWNDWQDGAKKDFGIFLVTLDATTKIAALASVLRQEVQG